MFLEIKKHDGVYISGSNNTLLKEDFRINLSLVDEITIKKGNSFYTRVGDIETSTSFTPGKDIELESQYTIKLERDNYYSSNTILHFTKEGMGEYQRIKRIIESQTLS